MVLPLQQAPGIHSSKSGIRETVISVLFYFSFIHEKVVYKVLSYTPYLVCLSLAVCVPLSVCYVLSLPLSYCNLFTVSGGTKLLYTHNLFSFKPCCILEVDILSVCFVLCIFCVLYHLV